MISVTPKIYGMSPGIDVGPAFLEGFLNLTQDLAPHERAQATVFVNTTRMRNRLNGAMAADGAMLLPKIRLITDLAAEDISLAPARGTLSQKLEIAQLVASLLEAAPDLAPRTSVFALADSLLSLMNEMAAEGVSFEEIQELDVTDQSGHWRRTLDFLNIIAPFAANTDTPDFRQAQAVARQIAEWNVNPPKHPVFVVGSTGSRLPTRTLMKAVSKLPRGGVILPGFDIHMPADVWAALGDGSEKTDQEDHPQYRFWKILRGLVLDQTDVMPWPSAQTAQDGRNKLISLAMRPVPVTDGWQKDGPVLGDLCLLTNEITLIEARTPKVEAEAIALCVMQAINDGKTTAIISPDRVLTRQVSAALDRWDVVADDSAGIPLQLTPPGRLLCHVGDTFTNDITSELLLVLLKHPLTHSTDKDRGNHLRFTRELELALRKGGKVIVQPNDLHDWVENRKSSDPDLCQWIDWIIALLFSDESRPSDARALLDQHISRSEKLCAGPTHEGSGALWDESAGRQTREQYELLEREIGTAGQLSIRDYLSLFTNVLSSQTERNPDKGRSDVLILGTLESRVHAADLVILGGLNDGVWPAAPEADPWLNRQMRKKVGLLSPERQIGLSAHDFQQAMGATEVVVTRSLRSDESETVPSRWLNRLTNLLEGLPKTDGPKALSEMRSRGMKWTDLAIANLSPEIQIEPAGRPSPQPPALHRPKQLSVTRIKTLIRDPYAIYAERMLRLPQLNTLAQRQEYQLRGVIFHSILQDFVDGKTDVHSDNATDILRALAQKSIADACPWPRIQLQWQCQFEKIAPKFIAAEKVRQNGAHPLVTEAHGKLVFDALEFTLVGIADRIDLSDNGKAVLYDYKTGAIPSEKQQTYFDKQLLLGAAMIEAGAFEKVPVLEVAQAQFLGINADMKIANAPLAKVSPAQVIEDFKSLIANWLDPQRGYTARMALFRKTDFGAYDHLSRFGEWGLNSDPNPEVVE